MTAGLEGVVALDGSVPHPGYGGWAKFLSDHCELRDECDGVRYFGATNCNYILFPTGELVENYGYHGRALMSRVKEEGWHSVLDGIKARRAELYELLGGIERRRHRDQRRA